MHDVYTIWESAFELLEKEVSKANINTWFKDVFLQRIDQSTGYIGVPSDFIKDWLYNKYQKAIMKSLRDSGADIRSLEFIIAKKPEDFAKRQPGMQKVTGIKRGEPSTLPLKDLYVNKRTNLNPRYTFDSFIIGSFNELAYSASQAILKKPGVYNPLYIYGETGLGKTHMIQAIGNALIAQYPHMKIFYTSSEKFTHDLVTALQRGNDSIFKIKEKYRAYDCLIMDDIQFISNRDKTQEELFHLFNILQDNNKQIIFSSDKHPNYIVGLEDRLKSRFSAGMIIDVTKPDFESRMAILKSKMADATFPLDPDIVDYVAQNATTNIRELEGILNTLLCQSEMKARNLTMDEVQETIRNSIQSRKTINAEDIARVVGQFYNLDYQLIYDKTRRKEVVKARQIAMYLLREDFSVSFPHIGRELGGRDHTTVIHSCTKIKNAVLNNPDINQEIEQIRSMIQTY